MNTRNDATLIHAFVDDELDLAGRLDFEDRLGRDAALAQEVEGLLALREAIRDKGDDHAAPAALRERVARALDTERQPPGAAPDTAAAHVRRWLAWRPLVASFGLVVLLAVALDLAWLASSRDDRLLDDVVASHVRSTLGQHLVDVASSDHHTVKPWLSSKLDFSPPVDELQLPGSVFLGGRVDYLEGHPVAALVYKQGAHVVNAFVWPTAAKDSEPTLALARGFRTAHWSSGGMTHWVISDVDAETFSSVVEGIRSMR